MAPVIESFASPALASSPAPGGWSFVTILICTPGTPTPTSTPTCYRMKWDVSCLAGSIGTLSGLTPDSVCCGTPPGTRSCSGGCGLGSNGGPMDHHCSSDPTDTTSFGTVSASCAAGISGTYTGGTDPTFRVINGSGVDYTLEAWQSHKGTCCWPGAGSTTPPVATSLGNGTSVTFSQPPTSC